MSKMNKWLLLGFSVLLFSTLAQGLVCNVCHFKLGKLCFRSGSPCRVSEGQLCETTTVYSEDQGRHSSKISLELPGTGINLQVNIRGQHPTRTMCILALLPLLPLPLLGMLLTWKNQQESRDLVVYGTNHPSSPAKYKGLHFNWLDLISKFLSSTHTEELSLHGLLKTRKHLEEEGLLSEAMGKCLVHVMKVLPHEPNSLQKNARLTLHCDGHLLEFMSGKGGNEVAMYDYDGKLHYQTGITTWQVYLIRFFRRNP